MKKRVIYLSVFCIIIVSLFGNSTVFKTETTSDFRVKTSIIEYVEGNGMELINAMSTMTSVDSSAESCMNTTEKISLGKPFIICDIRSIAQDEIYYFPVFYEKRLTMMLTVMGTSDGYTMSTTTEFVNELEGLQKDDTILFFADGESYIIYGERNNVIAKKGFTTETLKIMQHSQVIGHNF